MTFKDIFLLIFIAAISVYCFMAEERDLLNRIQLCIIDAHSDMTDRENLEGFASYVLDCGKCKAPTWTEGDSRPCGG